jgi:hypothetical protein
MASQKLSKVVQPPEKNLVLTLLTIADIINNLVYLGFNI